MKGRPSRAHLIDQFGQFFYSLAEQRDDRNRFVDGEPEWVLFERSEMLRKVNDYRSGLGRKAITLEDYNFLELTCSGHIDYARKLAIGCAELVLREDK